MRKFLIILVIANGLASLTFGQRFIPVNFTQPTPLTSTAGRDTTVCSGHPVNLGGSPTASGGSSSYLYSWSPADGLNDPTSSNPIADISESVSYTLIVTDQQGCQEVSFVSINIDACLGVDDNKLNQTLNVFPNPSNGVFSIQGLSSLNEKLQRIEVLNQLGQTVYSKIFNERNLSSEFVIDTNIKEPGIYFLKISLSDRLVSQRLIVR